MTISLKPASHLTRAKEQIYQPSVSDKLCWFMEHGAHLPRYGCITKTVQGGLFGSTIGRPSGTVGWPWNSRLESSGLTATRMDDTWPRSPADSARPGVARRPATRRPSQSTPALADSTAATRIAALDHGTLYVSLGSSSAVGGPAGWMTRNIARDNPPTAADKHPRTTTRRPVLTSQ